MLATVQKVYGQCTDPISLPGGLDLQTMNNNSINAIISSTTMLHIFLHSAQLLYWELLIILWAILKFIIRNKILEIKTQLF